MSVRLPSDFPSSPAGISASHPLQEPSPLAVAKAAAASRAYAAGSRDGAREMRLKAARLVAGAGCSCRSSIERFGGLYAAGFLADLEAGRHYNADCPAALAEAIRRLPDGAGE